MKQPENWIFLKVDFKYPEEVRNKYSDLLYCPEDGINDRQLPKFLNRLLSENEMRRNANDYKI